MLKEVEDALELLSKGSVEEIFEGLEAEREKQREEFERSWKKSWEAFVSESSPTFGDLASFREEREDSFYSFPKGPLTDLFEICDNLSKQHPPTLTPEAEQDLELLEQLKVPLEKLPLPQELKDWLAQQTPSSPQGLTSATQGSSRELELAESTQEEDFLS